LRVSFITDDGKWNRHHSAGFEHHLSAFGAGDLDEDRTDQVGFPKRRHHRIHDTGGLL
jgi:hypothetical protein